MQVMETRETKLEADHHDTLSSMNNLALDKRERVREAKEQGKVTIAEMRENGICKELRHWRADCPIHKSPRRNPQGRALGYKCHWSTHDLTSGSVICTVASRA